MTRERLVYSTDVGRRCPECARPMSDCRCRRSRPAVAAPAVPPGQAKVRVGRETAGRKGKGVTVVTGLPLAGDALDELATRLKKRCGTGGTVRDGVVEILGDHRDTLLAELANLGCAPKCSGG